MRLGFTTLPDSAPPLIGCMSVLKAAKIYDAAMAILFGEDAYRNLRKQDINREAYQETNARIEWFKYRMEKKKD